MSLTVSSINSSFHTSNNTSKKSLKYYYYFNIINIIALSISKNENK